MKKILYTICALFIYFDVAAQTTATDPKPANQGTVNEVKKSTLGGSSAKIDTSKQGQKSRTIPANPETSKLLLLQLFNAINNTSFKDTSAATKITLFKSLKGLQDLDYLKIFMPKLIAALSPSAFNKSWAKRESSWNKELKDVVKPIDFNHMLIDFETQLKPEMLSQKWNNEYRTKWLNEMQRVK